jgi:hypothetical protein
VTVVQGPALAGVTVGSDENRLLRVASSLTIAHRMHSRRVAASFKATGKLGDVTVTAFDGATTDARARSS